MMVLKYLLTGHDLSGLLGGRRGVVGVKFVMGYQTIHLACEGHG